MGCTQSKGNDDSHKGLRFILAKWLKPDELKKLETEQAEREAFLKSVTEGKKIASTDAELQAMNNDQLTEAFGPYFWLVEQHYYTPEELSAMNHIQIKAEAAAKSGVDGAKPTYEMCQELANKGTLLNLTAFNDKSVKSAAIFAFLALPAEAATISADEVKKRLAPFVKGGEEATKGLSDEDLFNACIALGAIRGLGSLPEEKLAETEIDKQRLVLVPLAMKAEGAGLGDAMKYKDKKAWELAESLPKTGKSIALQAFVGAYKPETEEDKKKKEEARAKKTTEEKKE